MIWRGPKTWNDVWPAVEQRRIQIGLTIEALIASPGLSADIVRRLRLGEPLDQRFERVDLCEAIHWTWDSIDRIVDGLAPVTMERDLVRNEQLLNDAARAVAITRGVQEIAQYREAELMVNIRRQRLGLEALERRSDEQLRAGDVVMISTRAASPDTPPSGGPAGPAPG